MKVVPFFISTILILTVFLAGISVSEKYRCKNMMVFRSYVHTLANTHHKNERFKHFSCESLISLKRWIDPNSQLTFVKTKTEKFLIYKGKKHYLRMKDGLKP
ncbi:hypothetical protein DAY19_06690 [Halobacteriovorax vibrionivorans]|uniref:Uncharacterized protein n=2 Tax=Halobacteriovorax TaxID=1652133 RepID=A0ABY0IEH6_9BACT|nr:hypothetical protein [Halobacteriovorax vibrionivorans]RZF21366.1 hypothetical protein DAY19_06690 [Halobacteriovorax vibrionivorans]